FSGSDSTVTRLQSPSGEQRFRIYHSNNPDYATPDTMNVTSSTGVNFPQRYYTWDATTGALSSFAFAGQYGLSMGYNTEQLRTSTSFPNSSGTRSESYTSLHGVIQSQFSNSNLHSDFYRGYEYDDIGRVKRVLGGQRWTYSYDNLGRLTGRVTEDGCVNYGENPDFGLSTSCGYTTASEAFSYDQVGNRTDLGGVSGTGNRIQSFNGITFFHDADGNVIQKYKGGVYNRQYWWSAEAPQWVVVCADPRRAELWSRRPRPTRKSLRKGLWSDH
ncbi:MAG: RHS repeat domain-containing protein, partial [Gemmatimonadaceae bacterium]